MYSFDNGISLSTFLEMIFFNSIPKAVGRLLETENIRPVDFIYENEIISGGKKFFLSSKYS